LFKGVLLFGVFSLVMNSSESKALGVKTGPSGRAMAQPMESELLDAFYDHITMERNASSQYFAYSMWFEERELRGFASYFEKESKSEQTHSLEMAKYLIARGQTVILSEVIKPKQSYENVEQILIDTFQLEVDVTSSLHQLYAMAERSSDTRTNVFLDPVIDNQVSSEDELAYLLGRVRFADNEPSAILLIDNELSKN
tara:strand:- start:1431 stop:2024 length:594 start_codon:yes stop_codon:yes gene_type:complete